MNSTERQIHAKLNNTFQPTFLEIVNESYMHAVPSGSETHFKVTLVSPQFEGKRQVQRHQSIYACLDDLLKAGVHALALHTFSPSEWGASAKVPESPQCLGGGKHSRSE